MTPIVKYKKLDPRAVVPTYATPGAAAADLCAVLDEPLTLAPMQRSLCPQRPVHQARPVHGKRRRCH